MDGKTPRERLLERIAKLLSVTEERGATKNEAIAAALQAQRLIAENDVSDEELYGSSTERTPVEVGEFTPYNGRLWRSYLASAVADNFRCKGYVSLMRDGKRSLRRRCVFYGYELDARAACMTYQKLARLGEKLAQDECRRVRALHGSCDGVKNRFLFGFVDGVRSELEKQSQALLLVVPSEVEDGFCEAHGGLKNAKRLYLKPDYSGSRVRGVQAGIDSIRASRLNTSDEYLLGC